MAFGEQSLGGAAIPRVPMHEQTRQFHVAFCLKIHFHRFVSRSPFEAVNAPVAAIPLFGNWIMAMLLIVPIDNVNSAIRTVLQIDRDIFWIRAEKLIFAGVNCVEARAEPT